MITGHLGIAGAAQAGRRDSSLLWLLGASMAPDVVDGLFYLARTCNPNGLYSHTLPAAALLAVVTGAIAYVATKQRATGALCALLVLAHLPPDFITGHKLFWPGGEIMGLRLYDHPIADFALESALVVTGWWLLRRRGGAPRWATGRAALVAVLVLQIAVEGAGAVLGGVKPSACGAVDLPTAQNFSPFSSRTLLPTGRIRPHMV
ncbi:MAG TPA: metal-dependent hydrolase [Gemmatimonadaceae bacterium]|nr:metal-dependent hydrolase [Gemmatimonadaceae bacterium]